MNLRILVIVLCSLFLAEGTQYRRWCYFTSWSQYRESPAKFKPMDIEPTLCTHISYAFATVKNGVVVNFEMNDVTYPWKIGMFEEVNNLKQNYPHLKTYLAIGGWNLGSKPFTDAVINQNTRKTFIDSAIQLTRKYKFDGIEIDWEYPANRGSPPEDKSRFTSLIAELRHAITNEQYVSGKPILGLSAAVAAATSKIVTGYEINSLSANLDYINLMSYDFHGAWEHTTGHNSPLVRRGDETGEFLYWNMKDSAEYWVTHGAPAHKMNIGLPTYGRTFTLSSPFYHDVGSPVSGAGKAGMYTNTEGFMAYYEICHFLRNGGTMKWDNIQKVPYAYKGDQWISYENSESLQLKVEWIKSKSFGGVMIWSLDLDDFAGMCDGQKYPLITTIKQALANTIYPFSTTPPNIHIHMMCQHKPNSDYPLPSNCAAFVRCNYGVGTLYYCPTSHMFEARTRTCVWDGNHHCGDPTTTTTTTTITLRPIVKIGGQDITYFCTTRADGVYDSPNACDEYIWCMSRKTFPYTCRVGQYFDPKSKLCIYKDQVPCVGPVIATPAAKPANFCIHKLDGFYANQNDCHKYFVCRRGGTFSLPCLNGQVFDNGHCTISKRIC